MIEEHEVTLSSQVQFPLSLVSIKFKHFLIFGLGGPIVNTLVWFALRVQDQGNVADMNDTRLYSAEDQGDIFDHGHTDTFSKWEDTDKSLICLFVEDKPMDVWVMQVFFIKLSLSLTPLTFAGADARNLGLQHSVSHLGHIGMTFTFFSLSNLQKAKTLPIVILNPDVSWIPKISLSRL